MDCKKCAQWTEALLSLKRKPVGVKFLLTREDYLKWEAHENKNKMSYCTVVRRATEGHAQKIHAGNMACMGGSLALGFLPPSEEVVSGLRRYRQGAYRDLGVCRQVSKNMVYCEHRPYGAAVMPLETFTERPDVVIVVCDAFCAMRLAQGYAYHHGHIKNIQLAGMQAMCQECTSYPYENNQPNITLMCSGTRMLGGWQNDELAVGMPYKLYLDTVDGLQNTVNPLERDHGKTAIDQRLKESGLDDGSLAIVYGKNYDDGAYHGGFADALKD